MLLPTRRKARLDGFDLDAEVAVAAHDRERREGLLRYFLRPPLSHEKNHPKRESCRDALPGSTELPAQSADGG